MALAPPPKSVGSLNNLEPHVLAGQTLHRIWRHELPDGSTRESPWYFDSSGVEPQAAGRYSLQPPLGTCYLATSRAGAILEALQVHLQNLPVDELRTRRHATLNAPARAPLAADIAHPSCAGVGITAALWAGNDRELTQAWAAALRRDGWWAIHGGIQHDPSGRLCGVALFDQQGTHAPTHEGDWNYVTATLHENGVLHDELNYYGVHVREPGELPYVELP